MLINRVSRLMGERRESIVDLARATGLTPQAAWAIYHDKIKRIEYRTLDLLCEHFGVAPCEILEFVPSAGAREPRHPGDVAG